MYNFSFNLKIIKYISDKTLNLLFQAAKRHEETFLNSREKFKTVHFNGNGVFRVQGDMVCFSFCNYIPVGLLLVYFSLIGFLKHQNVPVKFVRNHLLFILIVPIVI